MQEKRTIFRIILMLIVLVLMLALAVPALAQDNPPEEPASSEPVGAAGADWFFVLLALAPNVLAVAGAGGIVGGIVDLFKLTGKLKDGTAGRIQICVNFVLWAILWFAVRYNAEVSVREAIALFGVALPALIQMIAMFGGAKIVHAIMKWLDEQSFSLSARLAASPK